MHTFYHLLVNVFLASLTNFTLWFAITFFAYLQTQSVLATSLIAGIYLVISTASGFWLGSIVDHNSKKTVMLGSSFCSLFMYTIAYLLYITVPFSTFQDVTSPTFWIFIALLMFGVTAGNLRTIALPTLVTIMIPEDRRDKANGLVGIANGASFMLVSVISGFLVAWGGMLYALWMGLLITPLAMFHLLFLKIPESKDTHTEGHSPTPKKKIDIKGTIKVIRSIPGLFPLIFFTMFNNFLGGVFMALMDPYGLSLVSVEIWGLLWGALSVSFLIGGALIARFGLGTKPLRTMLLGNCLLWIVTILFPLQPSIILLALGMFAYMIIGPFIEASEQTLLQKVVPHERQGRVFGFAQSLETAASPITAFFIGPIAQFFFIPFMTTGSGVALIGHWFGIGTGRGIALVFITVGIIGLVTAILAMRTQAYQRLSQHYAGDCH